MFIPKSRILVRVDMMRRHQLTTADLGSIFALQHDSPCLACHSVIPAEVLAVANVPAHIAQVVMTMARLAVAVEAGPRNPCTIGIPATPIPRW